MKNNKILVFGYFGYVTDQRDGQTIKTRNIYQLLKQKSRKDIRFADSQMFRKSFRIILTAFRDLIVCKNIIYLPAHNNLKYIFPFIFLLSKIFGNKIIYIVIGGWLPDFLKNLPLHRWMLKQIKVILLENNLAKNQLSERFGILNTDVIPNFRIDGQ